MNNIQRPSFSVITATYNSGEIFNRTAISLAHQQFKDFEWIVIDGGSGDDTISHIQAHGEFVNRWISERDCGISDAWNKGLRWARGRYILILNAGDTYDPDFLQRVHAHIGSASKVICSHARLLSESGEHVGIIRSEPDKLYRAMHLAHNWCAVPHEHYDQLGGYADMKLAMDFEWFHRYYLRYGVSGFTVIDAQLGSYYLGGASDINYAESFRTNAQILTLHGTARSVAMFWRVIYTLKHALRIWNLKKFAR